MQRKQQLRKRKELVQTFSNVRYENNQWMIKSKKEEKQNEKQTICSDIKLYSAPLI